MPTEAQQLAAQRERQRKARVRRAEADRKRAVTDLAKAEAKLKQTKAGTYSRLDFERLVNDAKRRISEADETLRSSGAPVPATPGRSGSTTPGPGYNLRQAEAAALVPTAPRLAPIDRKNRDQVIWRQTELRNMGANITVDGVWGPITEWYEAMANNGDLTPETGGAASPTPATPPSSLGGLLSGGRAAPRGGAPSGGGGAPVAWTAPGPTQPPSSTLSAADFKTRVLAELPQAAAFLSIPELVPILQRRLDKAISDQEFAAQVQQTEWYRTTPQKSRAWLGLYAVDPATAERQVQEAKSQFKSMLGDYALDLADVTLEQWARKTLSGEVDESAFQGYLKEQAKSLFPTLAAAIGDGFTVRQYGDVYAQRAAQRLGVAPESINFSDEKWRRALVRVDPKTGERKAMNLDEWDNEIRTNPIYGYDNSAEAIGQAASFAQQIGERFGKVG